MRDLRIAQVGCELFEFQDFAGVQLFSAMALAANDVMVVVLLGVELEERFSGFGRDSIDDPRFFEGFQIAVDGD